MCSAKLELNITSSKAIITKLPHAQPNILHTATYHQIILWLAKLTSCHLRNDGLIVIVGLIEIHPYIDHGSSSEKILSLILIFYIMIGAQTEIIMVTFIIKDIGVTWYDVMIEIQPAIS